MAEGGRKLLTWLGVLTAHPLAFLVTLAYACFWFVVDRSTFDLHGIATLATWFMTLLIQRAEHRDTQAIHAKLDELLRAQDNARTSLTTIDRMQPEEIEKIRSTSAQDSQASGTHGN